MDWPLTFVVSLYLIGIFALSIYASGQVHDEADYVVAGRRLPLWLAWGTLMATWFGAATVLGAAEAARDEGVRGTLLDPFASGLALIVAGLFFAKPMWEMKLLTVGDFFAQRYGPRAELVASFLLIPGYLGWVGAQFVALGNLQEIFFGVPTAGGILIAAVIILAYTWIGGMWSVTLTDTLQLGVLLVGMLILGFSVFSHLGDGSPVDGVSRLFQETEPEKLTLLPEPGLPAAMLWLGTLASGMFGNIPGQDLMQRVFAANSAKTASRACVLAGVIYILFGLLPIGMGLGSLLLEVEANPQGILGTLAHEFLSPMLKAVFVVSLISIIVSTATSAVLSPATVLAHNLFGRFTSFGRRPLLMERTAVLLVVIGSVVMAYTGETILGLLETSVATVLVGLFVPLVVGIYGRRHRERAALLAMLLGIGVWAGRELLEAILLPPAEDVAAADYPALVAATIQPRWLATVGYYFALLPSSLSGLIASVAGYAIGSLGKSKSK
ncbi:MAG: sodium:solute symporter family protein [Planctomycetales bacterium]|nr:sodium:solute symporter family protein [Planctomycetales bacterium]